LTIDLGNGTGSFASGNFISLKNAGSQKFHIDSAGNAYATFASSGTAALCHATNGTATDEKITDCTGSVDADYAEMYPVASDITFGEIVAIGTTDVTTKDGQVIKQLVRSSKPYDENVIGIVSNNYGDFSSTGYNVEDIDHPMPVALTGRVPVAVNLESGPIQAGDYLTTSSVPGVAMKATRGGIVIGQALSDYDGSQSINQVMIFVENFYYDPTSIVNDDGSVTIQATSAEAAGVINQEGSGDIFQLQNNSTNRFTVQNSGATNINVLSVDETDVLVVVESNDQEVFSINARGQAAFAGNIIIKDDSFAGSIATAADGTAQVMFTYDLGSGKPDVQLTVEGESVAFAQIASWEKDDNGNYTGFNIKTVGIGGEAASIVVHYFVVGKESDYQTSGQIEVVTEPVSDPLPAPVDPITPPDNIISDESETVPVDATESGSAALSDPILTEDAIVPVTE
jgi:hypothetical protein